MRRAIVGVMIAVLFPACSGGDKKDPGPSSTTTITPVDCRKTGPYAVYVTNGGSNDVSVISDSSKLPIPTSAVSITPGVYPTGIALAPPGKPVAYISNAKTHDVSVLDTTPPHAVLPTPTAVGNSPQAIAISHDGTFAYVTNFGSDNLSKLDVSGNAPQVVDTIPAGATNHGPRSVAITPDDKHAVVTNRSSGTVSLIDVTASGAAAVISSLQLPGSPVGYDPTGPAGVAITSDNTYAYVVDTATRTLKEIKISGNTLSLQADLKVGVSGAFAFDVAIDSTDSTAYVTVGKQLIPVKLPLSTAGNPQPAIPVGLNIAAVALTGDDKTAYVTSGGSNKLIPIDLTTSPPAAGQPLGVGTSPTNLAIGCDISTTPSTSTTATPTSSTAPASTTSRPTATSSTTGTGVSTSSVVAQVSQGCNDVNAPNHDGTYASASVTDSFFAGETIAVTATAPFTGSPPPDQIELGFSPAPPGYTGPNPMTAPVNPGSGTLTYTFTQNASTTVTWRVTPAGTRTLAAWTVNCSH